MNKRENMNVKHWEGEQPLNITNINLSIRFKKTRGIFPSVTRVLIILPTKAATSPSAERASNKERVGQ